MAGAALWSAEINCHELIYVAGAVFGARLTGALVRDRCKFGESRADFVAGSARRGVDFGAGAILGRVVLNFAPGMALWSATRRSIQRQIAETGRLIGVDREREADKTIELVHALGVGHRVRLMGPSKRGRVAMGTVESAMGAPTAPRNPGPSPNPRVRLFSPVFSTTPPRSFV